MRHLCLPVPHCYALIATPRVEVSISRSHNSNVSQVASDSWFSVLTCSYVCSKGLLLVQSTNFSQQCSCPDRSTHIALGVMYFKLQTPFNTYMQVHYIHSLLFPPAVPLQSVRLYVHTGFYIRACTSRFNPGTLRVSEAKKVAIHAGMAFSVGLRLFYLFIPLVGTPLWCGAQAPVDANCRQLVDN